MSNQNYFELLNKVIKEAHNSGFFARIQSYYSVSDWKIHTKESGTLRIPSVFDLEELVRSLFYSLYKHNDSHISSGGLFAKREVDENDKITLSFGFEDDGPSISEDNTFLNDVIITDEQGKNLEIVSVHKNENNQNVYKVKALSTTNMKFGANDVNYSKLMKKYKNEFNKKSWGNYND